MTMTEALIGYAIGTMQILALGWLQTRASHRSNIRLLRAELRRLDFLTAKFEWRNDGPGSDTIPIVPELTPTFLQTVVATNFYITDEHADDNTQQALLELMDMTNALRHYSQACQQTNEASKHALGNDRLQLWMDAKSLADAYDEIVDRFKTQLHSGLADLDRRLADAQYWRQLKRMLRPLPKAENPPSMEPPSYAVRSTDGEE
jgi:hypothetical protein